tara:strand:+ start:465 stop:914 length:450 start_codon:yes stop_codon:yes gene_type:complete
MKNFIQSSIIVSLIFSALFSQVDSSASNKSSDRSVSPMIQIRYDNFANENFTPSSAIGMILKIDEDRYTGFDVNTSTNETRILMGWKWSMLGISVKEVTLPDDSIENVNMYSFGVKYGILDNMNAIIEYVLSGDTNTDDFLRLTVGVQF